MLLVHLYSHQVFPSNTEHCMLCIMGNLWFVRPIDCNAKHHIFQSINFPTWNVPNAAEINCTIEDGLSIRQRTPSSPSVLPPPVSPISPSSVLSSTLMATPTSCPVSLSTPTSCSPAVTIPTSCSCRLLESTTSLCCPSATGCLSPSFGLPPPLAAVGVGLECSVVAVSSH